MLERGSAEWYDLIKMYSWGLDRELSPSRIIGTGDIPSMIREFDWETTPLGRVETWSETLVTTINLLLASSLPTFLWWGKHRIQFYNDAFRQSIGDKHAAQIGQPGIEYSPEISPTLSATIDAVMIHGISSFHADQRVSIRRNGRIAEVFWTYSYSPVRGDGGDVLGALMACTETTERVLSKRRLLTLREIKDDRLAETGVPPEFSQTLSSVNTIVRCLLGAPADLPFAALYLRGPDGSIRSGSIGGNGAFGDSSCWPLAKLWNATSPLVLIDLQHRFTHSVCSPWPEPVTSACLLPLFLPGSSSEAVLVLGISPRLDFDQGYRMFFELVAARVAALIQRHVLEPERHGRTKTL